MSYAVITGASSGIGEEFAVQLAQRGHNLILLARRADRLSELAQRLSEQYGISAEILPADLADTQKLEVVADILRTRTDIAYLINNAGFGSDGMIWESDHQRQLDMLTVHTVAPYTLCRAVIPQMLNNNHGKIINVSSIAGFFHGEENVNYCATKAYLNSFSQGLQDELEGSNIHVQALCPGYTHSEFHSNEGYSSNSPEKVPKKMWMTAEEVVKLSLEKADEGKKVIYIPGQINRTMVLASQLPIYQQAKMVFKKFIRREDA